EERAGQAGPALDHDVIDVPEPGERPGRVARGEVSEPAVGPPYRRARGHRGQSHHRAEGLAGRRRSVVEPSGQRRVVGGRGAAADDDDVDFLPPGVDVSTRLLTGDPPTGAVRRGDPSVEG